MEYWTLAFFPYTVTDKSFVLVDGKEKYIANIELGILRKWDDGILVITKSKKTDIDLSGRDLSCLHLVNLNLSDANFSKANLQGIKINNCLLLRANFEYANLSSSSIKYSDLSQSRLVNCNLIYSYIYSSNFKEANLKDANIESLYIMPPEFSLSVNLPSNEDLMNKFFKRDEKGWIVYKAFNCERRPRDEWEIKENSTIEDVRDESREALCSHGINFATEAWIKRKYPGKEIWKCHIPFEDIDLVTMPYTTDGKGRTNRLKIIELLS